MHRSRPIPALALTAILAIALTACGDDASSPSSVASDAPPVSQAAESQPESAEPTASVTESEGEAESESVRLEGFAFDTTELTIAVGTRVTFTNADSAAHTVTEGTDGVAAEDPIVDVELAANQSDTVTFDEAGTYQITCLFHPSMNMTIVVEG